MTDLSVAEDAFAGALADILDRLGDATDDVLDAAVQQGCKVTSKQWKAGARSKFKGSGAYAKSISYRTKRGGHEAEGQVGSRTLPGLPHLLEKGHAKVGGGRVEGREHIASAAEAGFAATNEAIDSGLGEL